MENDTLLQTYKRTPYIFCASSESESRFYGLFNFINTPRLCRDSTIANFKMTRTSFTEEVRVKVPSFKKSHILLQYETFHKNVIRLHFCLFEDVTD